MEEINKRFIQFAERLENEPDYEMSDEMQETYYALKEDIEFFNAIELKEKFENLMKFYENPDDIIDKTLKDMYPDSDGEYDLDEWEG